MGSGSSYSTAYGTLPSEFITPCHTVRITVKCFAPSRFIPRENSFLTRALESITPEYKINKYFEVYIDRN